MRVFHLNVSENNRFFFARESLKKTSYYSTDASLHFLALGTSAKAAGRTQQALADPRSRESGP
jgi:hypothetical protein